MLSFDLAHHVALLPVYAASEDVIEGVDAQAMQQGMLRRGHRDSVLCADLDAAFDLAQSALEQGHIVLLLGAGSIGTLAMRMREQAAHITNESSS